MVKGVSEATWVPTDADITIWPVVPSSLTPGTPFISPVVALKLAHPGLPVTENVTGPAACSTTGWNRYCDPTPTVFAGLPSMTSVPMLPAGDAGVPPAPAGVRLISPAELVVPVASAPCAVTLCAVAEPGIAEPVATWLVDTTTADPAAAPVTALELLPELPPHPVAKVAAQKQLANIPKSL
jgi:hypothetical protein